jgi:hypothetical protein
LDAIGLDAIGLDAIGLDAIGLDAIELSTFCFPFPPVSLRLAYEVMTVALGLCIAFSSFELFEICLITLCT